VVFLRPWNRMKALYSNALRLCHVDGRVKPTAVRFKFDGLNARC
jgi:hypothetical protein